MKKHFICITLLFALLLLFGCDADLNVTVTDEDSGETATTTEENDSIDINGLINELIDGETETTDAAAGVSDSDFETKGYLYDTQSGDFIYFLVVKNNSDETVEISISGTAKDADGKELGTGEACIDILGPGEETICELYLSEMTGVKTVECAYTYNSSDFFYPVLSDLDVKQTVNDENIVLDVTNNSEYIAQSVEAYVLYFDADGNVISFEQAAISDGEGEVKPGKTVSGCLGYYKENDHAEVYLKGKTDGSTLDLSKYVSTDKLSVEEYSYAHEEGDLDYFLVITNNSSDTVSISANGAAKDSEGNTLSTDKWLIDVLEPGEQTVGHFLFGGIDSCDRVVYDLYCSTDVDHESAFSELAVQQIVTDNGVSVSVTNNGESDENTVDACALFFDKDGKVVGFDSAQIIDDNFEFRAGTSVTKDLESYNSFDSVKVFVTGSRYKE